VIAKCGDLVVHHWAHRAADCDPWSEPETPWHREWKSHAPQHRQEVVIGRHRADVVAPNGVVVEIQHSNIAGGEVRERERFYKRMLWIFDAREASETGRILIGACEKCDGRGKRPARIDCSKCDGTGEWQGDSDEAYGDCFACNGRGKVTRTVECEECVEGMEQMALEAGLEVYCVWKNARRDWTLAERPVVLDVGGIPEIDRRGQYVLRVLSITSTNPVAFVARIVPRGQVAAWISGGPVAIFTKGPA